MNFAVLAVETPSSESYVPLIMDRTLANAKYSIFHLQTSKKDFECAVKIFPTNKAAQLAFARERKILSILDHENIIKSLTNIKFNVQAYNCCPIAMEYAPYGDFFDLIFSQELNNEKLIRTYFRQLVEAIDYMHSKGLAHLDIKLENLLIGKDYQLKVADFDQTQALKEKALLYRGSPSTRAPEVIDNTCEDFSSADMYSIGVVLYTLATGDFPFLEKENENGSSYLAHYDMFCDNNKAFWELRTGQKPDKSMFNEGFKEIIYGLLMKNSAKRWTVKDIKASKWYKGDVLSKEELKTLMSKVLNSKSQENKEKVTSN